MQNPADVTANQKTNSNQNNNTAQNTKEPQLSTKDWIIIGDPEQLAKQTSFEVVIFEKKLIQENQTAFAQESVSNTITAASAPAVLITKESASTSASAATSNNTAATVNKVDNKYFKEIEEKIRLTHIVMTRKNSSDQENNANYARLPLKLNLYFAPKPGVTDNSRILSMINFMNIKDSIPGMHGFFNLPPFGLMLDVDKTTYDEVTLGSIFSISLRLGEMNEEMSNGVFEYLIIHGLLTKEEAQYFQSRVDFKFPNKNEALQLQSLINSQSFEKALEFAQSIHKAGVEEMQNKNDLDRAAAVYFYLGNKLSNVSPIFAIKAYELTRGPFEVLVADKIGKIAFAMNQNRKKELDTSQRSVNEKAIRNLYRSAHFSTVSYSEKSNLALFLQALEGQCGLETSQGFKLFHALNNDYSKANILITMAKRLADFNKANDNKALPKKEVTATTITAVDKISEDLSSNISNVKPDQKTTLEQSIVSATTNSAVTSITIKTSYTTPEGWELTRGDLTKFASAADNSEFLLFKKKENSEKVKSSKPEAKFWQERLSLFGIELSKHPMGSYKTGVRVDKGDITNVLSLLIRRNTALPIGNGERDYTESYSSNLAERIIQKILGKHGQYYNAFFYFHSLPINENNSFQCSLNFSVGNMREHMANDFFDTLIEFGIVSEKAANDFKNICGHRACSEFEMKMVKDIQSLIDKANLTKDFKLYDEAITIAANLSAHAINENIEKCINVGTVDDSSALFDLGMGLKSISGKHSLKAFKAITVYSPHYEQACDEMAQIAFDMSCSSEASREECIAYREEAIKHLFASGLEEENRKLLLCKLLELHAGYSPWGTKNRIFDKINYQKCSSIDLELALIMADRIFDFNQKNKTTIDAKAVVKSSIANSQTASATNTAASIATSSIITTIAPTAASSAAMTPSFNASISGKSQDVKGLEEDDDSPEIEVQNPSTSNNTHSNTSTKSAASKIFF